VLVPTRELATQIASELALLDGSTRIATFITAHDGDDRPYPFIGVSEGHHTLSHHQNDKARKDKLVKIQAYHSQAFAKFLAKLAAMPDGDGSMQERLQVYRSKDQALDTAAELLDLELTD